MNKIEIAVDNNRLDLDFINGFISNSYWAKGRTKETMQTCINNSLNFGVYFQNMQIGYARVVTDYALFAYILDLFITESYRGKGYSKQLMNYILNHNKLKDIRVWRLATTDAHYLYQKFGFNVVAKPDNLMELIRG